VLDLVVQNFLLLYELLLLEFVVLQVHDAVIGDVDLNVIPFVQHLVELLLDVEPGLPALLVQLLLLLGVVGDVIHHNRLERVFLVEASVQPLVVAKPLVLD